MKPIAVERIARMLSELSLLRYFPADDGARMALLRIALDMVDEDGERAEEQISWLVRRMTNGLYDEWPGPREFRACFCSRFAPRDGITVYSVVHPDGIPSEKEQARVLPEARPLNLPPGDVSADAEMNAAVKRAAKKLELK